MSHALFRTKQFTVLLLALLMTLSVPVAFVTTAAATPDGPVDSDRDASSSGETGTDNTTQTDATSSMDFDDSTTVWGTAEAGLIQQPGAAPLLRDQLALARELRADNDRSQPDDRALDMARSVLQQRKQWAANDEKPLPTDMVPLFEAQETKLDGSRKLLRTASEGEEKNGLSRAVELAQVGTKMQAAQADDSIMMSSDLPTVEMPNHQSPSDATLAIMKWYDVTPTADDLAKLRALDDLPESPRSALTDYLNAYLAFQHATADGNVTRTFASRNRLLGKLNTLNKVLEITDSPGITSPTSNHGAMRIGCGQATLTSGATFCVLQIDQNGVNSTYTNNTVVLIDTGGTDNYHMNAGGTNLDDDCAGVNSTTVDIDVAAALVDLGSGDDIYTRPNQPGCGQRGGALLGSGFLVDENGTDTYGNSSNADIATNGGAEGSVFGAGSGGCILVVTCHQALGFLLDAGGNEDTEQYLAGDYGTNGGASNAARTSTFGFLVNVNGPANYTAGSSGTNGGGEDQATGFLADFGSTDDDYHTDAKATNGGGIYESPTGGFLLDTAGSDNYTALSQGTNGGASQESGGFLLDAGSGDDNFTTGNITNKSVSNDVFTFNLGLNVSIYQGMNGVNGGGYENGVGVLINANGTDDDYLAGDGHGSNGGADDISSGLIVDTGGSDNYTAGYDPTQNATWEKTIHRPSCGMNGGGCFASVGAIVDTTGGDNYTAMDGHLGGINASNGGGFAYGVGLVADLGSTTDYYTATAEDGQIAGSNGGGSGNSTFFLRRISLTNFPYGTFGAHRATGTLVDNGGSDNYTVTTESTDSINNEYITGVNGGAFTGLINYRQLNLPFIDEANSSVPTNFSTQHGAPATGALIDVDGTDNYTATTTNTTASTIGVNGGAEANNTTDVALAVLLDAAGDNDEYVSDYCSGSSTTDPNRDDTILPKGIAGAQIDGTVTDANRSNACGPNGVP